jgi:hypothetical protein
MPCSRKNIDAWRPQKRSAIFAIAALSACSNRYVFYIRAVSARADALLSQKYRRLAPTKTFSYFRDSGVICVLEPLRILYTRRFCARRCLALAKISTPGALKNVQLFLR